MISLPDATPGKVKVFAMDFPHGEGVIKEGAARYAKRRRQRSDGHLETGSH
jgi:hypothetical protein